MRFDYTVKFRNSAEIPGSEDIIGAVRIIKSLPEDYIESAIGQVALSVEKGEKIFMNGYQTWTYCPEQGLTDYTRGLRRYPKKIVDHFGIDRYGDYHFVPYPETPGITHGVSYCYFRNGEKFRFFGSLDERAGYTLFKYDANKAVLTIERDCAGIRCGGDYPLFELFYAEGSEAEVFDAWFAAMGIKARTDERIAGYTSWYNLYQKITEESILRDLKGCAAQLSEGDLFQIDDGWEAFVGDWLDSDRKKFPRGMKALADDIHESGFKAGLWLAPFVCQTGSEIYSKHPDWLLRIEGKPWYCGCNWGGFWPLDIDNPEVVDYIERVFDRVFNEWGFDLVKLDFLYAVAPFGDENETRAGRMYRAMELLRRVCGDKLMLGCGVPLMPCFGLADYCRISCDVGPDWDNNIFIRRANREHVSTRQAIGNTISRRQLNGRAFLNDPDVFYLRDSNLRLSEERKYALAVVNSLFGGVLFHSDNMAEYSDKAKALYKTLLRIRDSEKVRVDNSEGLKVYYELDGIEQLVVVE